MVGACVSLTVTVKLHDDVLLDESVAVQVTVVTPLLKVEPEAGAHATVGAGVQLSVAVGAVKLATAVHTFGSVDLTILAGHAPIIGFCVSLTVTVKRHDDVLLDESVTVQVTVVLPFGNTEPDAGEQTTAFGGSGQLSLPVGVV